MTEPIFPEVVIGPMIYILIGFLLAVIFFLTVYIYRISMEDKQKSYNLNQLNVKKSRRDVLAAVIDEPVLQSELPDITGFSKSTVSQAIGDLKSDDLVKRKKRGNSYLIEPKEEKIRERIDRF